MGLEMQSSLPLCVGMSNGYFAVIRVEYMYHVLDYQIYLGYNIMW